MAVAELDGRPVVISAGRYGTVRVWELATGTRIGRPFNDHTGAVAAVAVAELDGRPVVITAGDDRTVRVWDLAKRRPVRRILRAVRLRHSAPIHTAITYRHDDRLSVATGCSNGTIRIWDLSNRRACSKKYDAAVKAIALLSSDRLVSAVGGTLKIGPLNQDPVADLTIELESEVLSLAIHGGTVVAATNLGLVALDIPGPEFR